MVSEERETVEEVKDPVMEEETLSEASEEFSCGEKDSPTSDECDPDSGLCCELEFDFIGRSTLTCGIFSRLVAVRSATPI